MIDISPSELERLNALADRAEEFTRALSLAELGRPHDYELQHARIARSLRAGERVEVELTYPDTADAQRRFRDDLAQIEFGTTWLDDAVRTRLETRVAELDPLNSHHPEAVTRRSLGEYGPVDANLAEDARRTLEDGGASVADDAESEPDDARFASHEVADVLRTELADRGFHRWRVEVESKMTARMSVNGPLARLRVRRDARFTFAEIARLKIHEIGTHVSRYEFGRNQPLRLLRLPLGSNLRTEEGLAVWNEEHRGVLLRRDVRKYAARVVAATSTLHGSITDVFESVLPSVGPDQAVDIAIRAKRGLCDPNAPGGSVKDACYYAGWHDVSRLIAARPDAHSLLMSCKQPAALVDQLDALRDAQLLKPVAQ